MAPLEGRRASGGSLGCIIRVVLLQILHVFLQTRARKQPGGGIRAACWEAFWARFAQHLVTYMLFAAVGSVLSENIVVYSVRFVHLLIARDVYLRFILSVH